MKHILQSLKVIVLAFALSLGISYVSAWTAPMSQPPAGNTSAPINVGSTAQTKAGNLTVSNDLTAPVFKDQNDPTNFFVNPNGDSKLNNIFTTGSVDVAQNRFVKVGQAYLSSATKVRPL